MKCNFNLLFVSSQDIYLKKKKKTGDIVLNSKTDSVKLMSNRINNITAKC